MGMVRDISSVECDGGLHTQRSSYVEEDFQCIGKVYTGMTFVLLHAGSVVY